MLDAGITDGGALRHIHVWPEKQLNARQGRNRFLQGRAFRTPDSGQLTIHDCPNGAIVVIHCNRTLRLRLRVQDQ